MTPKKQDRTMTIIIAVIAVFIIGAYSIKVAQYHFLDPEATSFQCILFAYKTFENQAEIEITLGNIGEFLKTFFYSFFMLGFITTLVCYYYYAERKAHPTDMFGKEHGTAKWNDNLEQFQRKYMDMKNGKPIMNQMVLSNVLRLTLNTRKSLRNLIKVIIGGSGAGKSRFFVKPNVLQFADMSMLINDPSGEILESTGKALQYNGYDIKIFNIVDMEQSHRYNPFDYIRDTNSKMKENGVTTMVSCILANTTDPNAQKGDPFWDDSIRALFQAICFLLVDFYPKEERTIAKVYDLVLAGQVDENNTEDTESELDKIFREKETQAKIDGIKSKAFKNYKTFKLAGVKTASNILISAGVRVQNFDNTSVRHMTTTDTKFPENNLHLEAIGNKKTALFVILPIADDTFKFLPSLMYSQMIETLYYTAENVCPKKFHIKSGDEIILSMYDSKKLAQYELEQYKKAHIENEEERINNPEEDEDGILNYSECRIIGEDGNILKTFPSYKSAREFLDKIKHGKVVRGRKELPHHTQLIQDELANTGTIPNYSKIIATMRKYKMGADIILQNQQQLEGLYKDDFKSIMGNADTLIFLGSNETDTAKNISDMLGNTTIKTRSVSQQKGKNGGYSVSWSSSQRKLMEPDEVLNMENDKCIVKIRGVHPFLTEKYQYEEHPNYKYTGDCWDENKVMPDDDFYNKIFKGREDSQNTQKAIHFKRRIANMYAKNKDENGKPLIGKLMPMNTEGQVKDALEIRSKDDIKEKIGVAENVNLPKDPDKGILIPDETLMWGF